MIWLLFPAWLAYLIGLAINHETADTASLVIFMGLSIVTAAFAISWRLYCVAASLYKGD